MYIYHCIFLKFLIILSLVKQIPKDIELYGIKLLYILNFRIWNTDISQLVRYRFLHTSSISVRKISISKQCTNDLFSSYVASKFLK